MSIEKEFMRLTTHTHMPVSGQNSGVPQPPLQLPYPPDAQLIPLPPAAECNIPPLELREAILRRRSVRQYSPEAIRLDELAFLLWASQGVKHISSRPSTARTVPSAGARHAFETYLLINRVEGLQPGLYRYIAIEHALLPVDLSAGWNENIADACLKQEQVRQSAVTFIWVAVVERMTWRYPVRGYRYLFLDAGHVCQNLYLAAEAVNCGVCAIAAYDDEVINPLLGLDGEEQFVIYLGSLGRRLPR